MRWTAAIWQLVHRKPADCSAKGRALAEERPRRFLGRGLARTRWKPISQGPKERFAWHILVLIA